VFAQRRAVREAHARLRLYDVGWRRNAAQVFGTAGPKRRWRAWVARLSWGGPWYAPPPQFRHLFRKVVDASYFTL